MSMFGSVKLIGALVSDLMSDSERRAGVAAASLDFAPRQGPAGIPDPEENGSGATTAGVAASGDQRIDGLLSGIRWAGSITYSDPDSAADYQASHPENFTNFQQINAAQLLAAHAVLDNSIFTQPLGAYSFSVEGFTNLSISYAGTDTGAGTIRLANTDDPSTAYAYYPSTGVWGGDVFFGPSGAFPTSGNYDAYAVIHEIGHALGLKHGHETGGFGALPFNTDSMEYSVMTYKSFVGSDAQFIYNETWGYAQSFMMYDIAALQRMYGADFSHNGGNTVYTWNPTNGESYVNGNLAIDPGGNRIFSTIWDGNGIDSYDLSNYATNLSINLNPGGFSTFSATQLADLNIFGGNTARGNVFNALQYQGDARSLIENATGGSGSDLINGNAAANALSGNGGNDSLVGGVGNDSLGGGDGNDSQLGGDGNDTIFSGIGNDSGVGGAGNDSVLGGNGSDALGGESGNDTLGGGTGKDVLVGGSGNDVFDFNLVAESPFSAACDELRAGGGSAKAFDAPGGTGPGDRIDLSGLDANANIGGDQGFGFGTATTIGRLWCLNSGTTTRVYANIDGDAAIEFRLDIFDGGTLANAYKALDFIL